MRTRSTALAKTGSSENDTVFGSVDNHWVVLPEMKPAIKNNKPRQNEILGNAISWKERSDKPNGVSHLPVSLPDSHTPVKPRSPWFSWSSISKKPWLWAWVLFYLFFFPISKFKDRKILLGSPPAGISAGFLGWFSGLLPKSTQSLEPALSA